MDLGVPKISTTSGDWSIAASVERSCHIAKILTQRVKNHYLLFIFIFLQWSKFRSGKGNVPQLDWLTHIILLFLILNFNYIFSERSILPLPRLKLKWSLDQTVWNTNMERWGLTLHINCLKPCLRGNWSRQLDNCYNAWLQLGPTLASFALMSVIKWSGQLGPHLLWTTHIGFILIFNNFGLGPGYSLSTSSL